MPASRRNKFLTCAAAYLGIASGANRAEPGVISQFTISHSAFSVDSFVCRRYIAKNGYSLLPGRRWDGSLGQRQMEGAAMVACVKSMAVAAISILFCGAVQAQSLGEPASKPMLIALPAFPINTLSAPLREAALKN